MSAAAAAPILTEVCYLLERECGTEVESGFCGRCARGEFTLVALTSPDLDRMIELVQTYDDLPLGAADASVVAVAERFGTDGWPRWINATSPWCGPTTAAH